MVARVPATDSSVSWRRTAFPTTRVPPGREYAPVVAERRHDALADRARRRARALLDVNELADGIGYVELGLTMVSPDERRCWPTRSTTTATRSTSCGSATCAPARTSPRWSRAATTAGRGAPTRRTSSTPSTTRPTGPYQVWRHRLGTPVAEDVLVLEEPDERFELTCAATRSGDLVVIWAREPRHHRGVGRRRPRPDLGPARRSAADGRASSTTPSTCATPDGPDALLVVTNDGATEFRLCAPGAARRRPGRTRPGGAAARGPRRAAGAGRRLRRPRGARAARPGRAPAAGAAARRPRPATGSWSRPASDPASLALGAQRGVRRRPRSTVVDQSYVASAGLVATSTSATGARTELHRQRRRATTPRVRLRATHRSRRPTAPPCPATRGAPPRHPARRHRAGAALRLRRLRVRLRAGVGPGAARACSTAASSSCTPTSAAAARAVAAGGSTGGCEHKQNTFNDHLAVADALASAGWSTGPGSPPAV